MTFGEIQEAARYYHDTEGKNITSVCLIGSEKIIDLIPSKTPRDIVTSIHGIPLRYPFTTFEVDGINYIFLTSNRFVQNRYRITFV